MDKRVREILFEPLRKNILSAIIPDFVFYFGDKEISAPAQLVRRGNEFQFILHFNTGQPPPELQSLRGGFVSEADQRTVRGQINGELAFCCDDVFPPTTMKTRSRGTSITILRSNQLNLVAEGADAMTTTNVNQMNGQPIEGDHDNRKPFSAHVIYDGPKLNMYDAGTRIVTKNDFLKSGRGVRAEWR
jgi:hypothetical protein